METNLESAIFAGGCFWCTEAIFNSLRGVKKVISGYTGGAIKNPAYREVCSGRTGHAEGIRLYYNPKEITYTELLELFFATHDPTTPNRQGNDKGTQYRSAIFYTNENQKNASEKMINYLNDASVFENPIVTEVNPLDVFYEAEDDHQEYYEQHQEQPYCQIIISPKLKKLQTYYRDKLKSETVSDL